MLARFRRRTTGAAVAFALHAGCGGDDGPTPTFPPANACMPHLPANWAPQWKPPADPRPACSAAQIDAEYASCEGAGATQAACSKFRDDPANAGCESCLFSDGHDASYGPIILANGLWKSNTPGCIALLDGDSSASGCGARAQAASNCYDDACLGCSPTEAFIACRQQALGSVCRPYYLDAVCLLRPEYASCTEYPTSEAYFRSAARFFCWNGFTVRAPTQREVAQ